MVRPGFPEVVVAFSVSELGFRLGQRVSKKALRDRAISERGRRESL